MSATVFRDLNSVTTLLAIENQLAAALGVNMTYRPETTINKKYGILPDVQPTTIPRIRYFGIGIKGYANLTSENNIAQPFRPSATDCDLYEPIPFRCVPFDKPLDSETASQYVIWDVATIKGVKYRRYWLKKIEFESSVVRLTKIEDREETQYTMDASQLYPVPRDLYPTDIAEVQSRITASVIGKCIVTGEEVTEVINAMYDGDLRRARISEIGTYSGIPVTNKDVDGNDYTEAAYVQLCTHKTTTGQILSDPTAYFVERKNFESGSTVII